MDIEGLDIVLSSLAQDLGDSEIDVTVDLGSAKSTAAALDDVEARIEALKRQVPQKESPPPVPPTPSPKAEVHRPAITRRDWADIREQAEIRLRERGIDPATVSLDALLDPEEVARIQRRFQGGFTISTHLDAYDIGAMVAAGLTAALVDFLIVRIPKDHIYRDKFPQTGSPFTKWVHSLSVSDDNWLAQRFKVSYDKVNSVDIAGLYPRSHRLQTLGHDPLVGLVVGTIDIMRGGMTAISKDGELVLLSGTGTAQYDPFIAFVWVIMHLFSDGFTEMGLPAPGWSLHQLFRVGGFGPKERTVAELARWMYRMGYDSRHFLTMATSVAAVEVVLRGYFSIRRHLDEEYDGDMTHAGEAAGARRTGQHPHFQSMALGAHALAAAANAGKVAIYAGNPLAINYAQWLRFFHATFEWMRTRMRSPSDVLKGHAYANWKALQEGWSASDVSDPSFPSLVVE